METEVKVSSTVVWIGAIDIVFFLACAVGAWASGQEEVSPWFLAFVPLGLYLVVVGRERLVVNAEVIERRTAFNTYRMRFDEIQMVETDAQMNAVVVRGPDKQLVIYGPGWYAAGGGERSSSTCSGHSRVVAFLRASPNGRFWRGCGIRRSRTSRIRLKARHNYGLQRSARSRVGR